MGVKLLEVLRGEELLAISCNVVASTSIEMVVQRRWRGMAEAFGLGSAAEKSRASGPVDCECQETAGSVLAEEMEMKRSGCLHCWWMQARRSSKRDAGARCCVIGRRCLHNVAGQTCQIVAILHEELLMMMHLMLR